MRLVITVKMVPESAKEIKSDLSKQIREVKEHFETIFKEGVLGPSELVSVRYLIIGNEWKAPIHAVGD